MAEFSDYVESRTDAAGTLDGSEILAASKNGSTVRFTTQQLVDEVAGGGGGGTTIPYGTTSGTATLTATMSPAVTSYTNGDLYMIRMGATTVGNATLNLNSVGAKKIYDTPEKQISIDDLVQNRSYLIQYDSALDAAAGGFAVIGEISHERLSFRDNYDASGNAFPVDKGSGYLGAIRLGDLWRITVAGTLDGVPVSAGDIIIALGSGATIASWMVLYGYASMDTKLALKQPLATRVQSVTSSATVTPNADTDDMVKITAQAAALDLANPSGTPTEGQGMVIRIKDDGTARAITYGTQYREIGVVAPTTTVISKTTYIAMIFNTTDTKWDVVFTKTEI